MLPSFVTGGAFLLSLFIGYLLVALTGSVAELRYAARGSGCGVRLPLLGRTLLIDLRRGKERL